MHFVIPISLCLAAALLAAVSQIWFWRRTALRGKWRLFALALRLTAIVLVTWILTGPTEFAKKGKPVSKGLLVLSDISKSMDFPGENGSRRAQAQQVIEKLKAEATDKEVISWTFGQHLTRSDAGISQTDTNRNASLPAAALREIINVPWQEAAHHSVLLISDGAAQDENELVKIGKSYQQRGIPIGILCTGGPVVVKNAAILALDVEKHAKPGTKVPLAIVFSQTACKEPLHIEVVDENGQVVDHSYTDSAPGMPAEQTLQLAVTTGPQGFTGKVRIVPVAGEVTLSDNEAEVAISPEGANLRVLYLEGTISAPNGVPEQCILPLALSEAGDIDIDLICPLINGGSQLAGWPWKAGENGKPDLSHAFPKTKEELAKYDVIICSDIPREAFTAEQLRWTVDLVAKGGAGFIMIGGDTSFGTGQWDRTVWSRLVPVDMDENSRETYSGPFQVFWTDEGMRHPLLADMPLESGEELVTILNAHPTLFGTNVVNRAKPAATVLMRKQDAYGQPLLAVEPFGKGRTMAFTSDITTDWGHLHETRWGSKRGQSGVQGAGFNAAALARFRNDYYKRFWQRSVRWLGENSVRSHTSQLTASTNLTQWSASKPLPIVAGSPDESLMASLSTGACYAEVRGMASTRTPMIWNAQGQNFQTNMACPPGLPERTTIDVTAENPQTHNTYQASFTIRVPNLDSELAAPSARPDLLEALAKATGGKVLRSSVDATNWLNERRAALLPGKDSLQIPLWDRLWVWSAIFCLLAGDWILRRVLT